MGKYAEGSYWYYAPNKVVPIVAGALFLISGLWHLYQCIHYKCFKMLGFILWACTIFIAANVLREVGAFNYDNQPIFIASTVMYLAAPPIYAVLNCVILGRMLFYIPYLSPIHPGRVVTTFIGISSVIEALTANGAAYLANSSNGTAKQKTGGNLVKSALIVQLLVELLFYSLAIWFHRRCIRAGVLTPKLRTVLRVLYLSSLLITTRSIYRVIETFQALDYEVLQGNYYPGRTVRDEPFFWVFDILVMAINSFLLNVMHPARFLPESYKVYLSKDGTRELVGPGWEDKRPFVVTLFDPFDLVGLVTGQDKKNAFWENEENAVEASPGGREDVGGRSSDVELVGKGNTPAREQTLQHV